MARTEQLQRRRRNLYALNPHCLSCGVFMVLPESLPKVGNRIKVFPPNTCTLAHRFSRLHPDRSLHIPFKHGILCRECNNRDGQRDVNTFLTKKDQRLRARNGRKG